MPTSHSVPPSPILRAGTVDIEDMFGVEHDVPYLLNVSDDPLLTGARGSSGSGRNLCSPAESFSS